MDARAFPPAREWLPVAASAAFVAIVALAAGHSAVAAPPKRPVPPPATGSLGGTIVVHGCLLDASDLLVRARPMSLAPGRADVGSPRGMRSFVMHPVRTAPAGSAGDVFAFSFDALARGVPYRIGVKVVGESLRRCPRLAWDADREPLVLAGDEPLAFDAYAVPSELEVLGAAERRRGEAWVGGDAVDFLDPARATRQFRWRTSIADATGGELQVSLVPYPRLGTRAGPCAIDEGALIHREAFTAVPGRWSEPIAIDFNVLLYPSRPASASAKSFAPKADPDVGALDPATLEKIELGRPLYLRVVPTNADGPICDPDVAGVPSEVLLARLLQALLAAPQPTEPRLEVARAFYQKPWFDAHPTPNEVCYRVTQRHDYAAGFPVFASSWEIIASSKRVYDSGTGKWYVPAGARFCACTNCNDDGWFESFTDTFGSIVTGLVDAVAKLVNEASELWQKVQDAAVDAVADGITALPLGVDCDDTCQTALETGLEIGLATMGVPPSLPNFDALVDQGFDYLAAQAMSEIGVPPTIAGYASDQLSDAGQKFMNASIDSMKASPYSIPKLPAWLVPDLRFDRAYLTLELYGQGTADAQAFTTRPAIILNNDPIFAGTFVKLPRKIPAKATGTPLVFPLVLEPNLAGLPPPPPNYGPYHAARVDKKYWLDLRYKNGCYHLYLTALLPDPADVYHLFASNFRTEDPAMACGP